MDPQMLERVLALVETNLLASGLMLVTYGFLLGWVIRETRLSHQALAQVEASNERIALMVRELHNR